MNSFRPEAEPEYSRGPVPSRRPFAGRTGPTAQLPRPLALALVTAGLAGAALLVAAEFAPLLTVRTSVLGASVTSVRTSTHDAWALVPLAFLTVFLSIGVWRTGSRLGMLALGVVGISTVLIALLADLPDAQATGLVGSPSTRYAVAASSPAAGFYLETLGAVVIIIAAGAGLLLSAERPRTVGGG
jgi:hypothetical protein